MQAKKVVDTPECHGAIFMINMNSIVRNYVFRLQDMMSFVVLGELNCYYQIE